MSVMSAVLRCIYGEARVRGDILHRTEDSSLDYDSFVHFMQILNENDGFNAEDLYDCGSGWVSSSLGWMFSKWMYKVTKKLCKVDMLFVWWVARGGYHSSEIFVCDNLWYLVILLKNPYGTHASCFTVVFSLLLFLWKEIARIQRTFHKFDQDSKSPGVYWVWLRCTLLAIECVWNGWMILRLTCHGHIFDHQFLWIYMSMRLSTCSREEVERS